MNIDLVRAWKDESYRNSLKGQIDEQLLKNPIGEFELTDEELERAMGAAGSTGGETYTCTTNNYCTCGCCCCSCS